MRFPVFKQTEPAAAVEGGGDGPDLPLYDVLASGNEDCGSAASVGIGDCGKNKANGAASASKQASGAASASKQASGSASKQASASGGAFIEDAPLE